MNPVIFLKAQNHVPTIIKGMISPHVRIRIRILIIFFKDLSSLQYFNFVKKQAPTSNTPTQLSLSQPIKKTRYSDNKKHNLGIAIQHLQNKVIQPGKILSFWHLVPPPVSKHGYKKGRNIMNDRLDLDYGGGLCQLSGVLYHLSLQAGLEIVERHPHSLDLYTEETRYTPLGADATVVYGYKDLRIKNNLSFPVCFQFEIKEQEITARVCATNTITECQLDFQVEHFEQYKKVSVWNRSRKNQLVSRDIYKNFE